MQEQYTEANRNQDGDRAGQEASHAASQPIGRDIDRCDVHIFQGLVMLAVINHSPRNAGHDRADVLIEGIAVIQIREDRCIEITLCDDAIHDHQNRGACQRFDDGINGKQKRLSPVRFDLPAEPGGESS